MKLDNIYSGLRVITTKLESTVGMLVHPDHLANRKPHEPGRIVQYVPGHGGVVWFVRHGDDSIAAYGYTEFQENTAK